MDFWRNWQSILVAAHAAHADSNPAGITTQKIEPLLGGSLYLNKGIILRLGVKIGYG